MVETIAHLFFLAQAEGAPKTPPLGFVDHPTMKEIALRVHPRALRDFEKWIVRQPRRRK